MSVSVSVCLCSGVVNHCSLPLPQTEEFVGDLYPSPPEIAFICDALNRHFGRPKNYNGSLRHWNTEYKLEDSANGGRERRSKKGAYQNIIQKVTHSECSSKVTTQFGKNPKLRLSSPEIRGYDSVRQKSKVTTRFGKNPKLRLGSPKI